MRINNDNISFQSLKCHPNVNAVRKHLCKNMNSNDVDICLFRLSSNKPLTELSLIGKGKPRLRAEVDGKKYKETWFSSAKNVINKTVKTSDEANSIELIAEVMKILSKMD